MVVGLECCTYILCSSRLTDFRSGPFRTTHQDWEVEPRAPEGDENIDILRIDPVHNRLNSVEFCRSSLVFTEEDLSLNLLVQTASVSNAGTE